MTRNYDWFDLIYSNPDKQLDDFALAGVSDKNTVLKDASFYKDKPQVQETFTDPETNQFNEQAFQEFYDSTARLFNNYIQSDLDKKALTENFGIEEIMDQNRLTGEVYLKKVANPTLAKEGISGVFKQTAGTRSMREAAQDNLVRDWQTGQSLGYTPNDDDRRGLIDFLGLEPLVEARWEEDGWHTDLSTGKKVKHQKGDWKLDENGNPYYETLGDRDVIGKNLLHITDTLTVDGTTWNKFDPFDSDGISKNIGGQIVKTAAAIAPLLIPGVRETYGLVVAAALLSRALATFGKAGLEAVDADYKNSLAWNIFNQYDGYLGRFDTSVSDEGSTSMMNFEQATNLISDVVSQLYQQRAIAKIPQMLNWNSINTAGLKKFLNKNGEAYLKKYGKTLNQALKDKDMEALALMSEGKLLQSYETVTKIQDRASELSKLYMVLTQTEGVYDTFKENGFDETTTALGLLGTAYGFHRLFKTSLGDVALSGLGLDELGTMMKPLTKKTANDALQNFQKMTTEAVKKDAAETVAEEAGSKISKYVAVNKIKEYGTKFADNFKKLLSSGDGIGANALKESLEETSEELLQDGVLFASHAINSALDTFGIKKQTDTYSYLNTQPFERYLISAFGGAVGGAVFPLMTKWENFTNGNIVKELPKDDLRNWITILRKNPFNKVEQKIMKDIQDGKFGSTTLSAERTLGKDGKYYFKSANKPEESQNYIIGHSLLNMVRSINSILNTEIGSITDEDVINSALGKELRAKLLIGNTTALNTIANDFNDIVTDLVSAEAKERSLKDGEQLSPQDSVALSEARRKYQDFINGKRSADYVDKMAFLLNPSVNAAFLDSNIQIFSLHRGKAYNSLNGEDKAKMDELFKYSISNDSNKNDAAFEVFKHFRDKVYPELVKESTDSQEALKVRKQVQDAIANLQESVYGRVISKDEIKAQEESIRKEYSSLDDFIAGYDLDPNNEIKTEEDKQKAVDIQVAKMLNTWKIREGNKRLSENVARNMLIGLDKDLLLANEQDQLNLYNTLLDIYNRNGSIDVDSLNKINGIFNTLNSFAFTEEYQQGLVKYFTDMLSNNRNKTYSIDAYKNKVLNSIAANALGTDEATIASMGIEIGMNDSGQYFLKVGQEDYEEIIPINPDEDTIEHLLTDEFYLAVKDSNVWSGGLFNDRGVFESSNNTGLANDIIAGYFNNTFGNSEKVKTLTNTSNLLKTITATPSPMRKMLSILSKEFVGEDIFDVITRESRTFTSLSNLSDFVLEDKLTEDQIRTALDIIKMMRSIIAYSKRDRDIFDPDVEIVSLVDIVNQVRRSQGLPELPILDDNSATIMLGDLSIMENDLKFILELASSNSVSKRKDSTLTMVRNEAFLLNYLCDPVANSYLFNGEVIINDKNFFNFDIIEHSTKINKIISDKLSDDESVKFIDSLLTQAQEYYYNKFQQLTEDQQTELLRVLARDRGAKGGIGINYTDNTQSEITRSNTASDLKGEFLANFIVSTLVLNQAQVKRDLAEEIEGSNTYAPFFGQYLAISMGMAEMEKPDLINKFLDLRVEESQGIEVIEKQPFFHNIITILGDPGSGKTTAIAHYIRQLIKKRHPDAKIVVSAPNTDQAYKLSRLLGEDKYYNKTDLFNDLILNDKGKVTYEKMMSDLQEDNFENYGNGRSLYPKEYDGEINTISEPVYIFIDEYTHFSSYEMQILSKTPNVRIVALGDQNQSGCKLQGYDNSISGFVFSSPELRMSVRAANGYKKDNLTVVATALRRLYEAKNATNLGTSASKLDLRKAYRVLRDDYELRYYEDGNRLQGDKIINRSTVNENYVRNLLSTLGEGEKIALIVDDKNKDTYKLFNKLASEPELANKIIIKEPTKVQGSEYKYVVLDVRYDLPNESNLKNFNNTFYSILRDFYTHITRSSDGTIIVNTNNNLPMSKSKKLEFPNDMALSQSDIDSFRDFVLDIYKSSAQSSSKTKTEEPVKGKKGVDPKQIEKELKEKRKQQKAKDDAPEFQRKNLGLYFRTKHIGLSSADKQLFTPIDNNEDLNIVLSPKEYTREEILNSSEYKSWNYLRAYTFSRDKAAFLDNITEDREFDSLFSSFTNKITGKKEVYYLKERLKNNSKIKLKISKNNPATDYQFNQLDYNRTDANYARLVLQITGEDGKLYDITIADISASDNILNEDFKKLVTQDYSEPVVYYDVDESKIDFRGLSTNSDKTANEFGLSLEELKKENPELSMSRVYYETTGNSFERGQAFVLVDDNPFLTDEQLRILYGNNTYGVEKINVTEVAYDIDSFFDEVNRLKKNLEEHGSYNNYRVLKRFVPDFLAARLIRNIYILNNILSDANKIKEFNDRTNKENQEAEEFNKNSEANHGLLRRAIKRKIENSAVLKENIGSIINSINESFNPDDARSLITGVSLNNTTWSKILENCNINSSVERLFGDTEIPKFSKDEITFLKSKTGTEIPKLFNDLKDENSSLYKNHNLVDKNSFIERIKKVDEAFSKIKADFSGKYIKDIDDILFTGANFHTQKNLDLVTFLASLKDSSNELYDALVTAIGVNDQFKNGIISNGRDTTAEASEYEGYIPANKTDAQVYSFKGIYPRHAYIPFEAIKPTIEDSQVNINIEESINQEIESIKNNVDPSIHDIFNSVFSEFKIDTNKSLEDNQKALQQFINNNYTRIVGFSENQPFYFVSLQLTSNGLKTKKERLNKRIITENWVTESQDFEDLVNDELKFDNNSVVPRVISTNGNKVFSFEIDKKSGRIIVMMDDYVSRGNNENNQASDEGNAETKLSINGGKLEEDLFNAPGNEKVFTRNGNRINITTLGTFSKLVEDMQNADSADEQRKILEKFIEDNKLGTNKEGKSKTRSIKTALNKFFSNDNTTKC